MKEVQSMNYNKIQPDRFIPESEFPQLVVMIGFSPMQVEDLIENKLLSLTYPCKLSDFKMDPKILMEVSQRLTHGLDSYWCTMEEYQFFIQDTFSNFFSISFIFNNLYYRQFPLFYEINEINRLIDIFLVDDENIPEDLSDTFDFFTKFYSSVINNGLHYISYSVSDEIQEKWTPYFSGNDEATIESAANENGESILEISEDESLFLQLTQEVLKGTLQGEYILVQTANIKAFTNNYLERINLLNEFSSNCKLVISKKKLKKQEFDETEYLTILNKYWGYNKFRNLPMYNDPDQSNELTDVSQSQIIHDLISNATNAIEGKPFRDIFITSPTGAGKSIMFQIPSLFLFEKSKLLTIVISPLIGLMKDQVENLKSRGIDSVETINSDITPIEKANIKDRVHAGEISTLYISPETLLSRSDIKMLIGDRRVGLFIVDEAHIVTTWGKAFRADYWYLGTYLQKLRKEMKFPIATFTATAIYGGEEDMYKETRDSLALLNPITYLGEIRREDININLNSKDTDYKGKEYLSAKFVITSERVRRFQKNGKKTLIYFPTVSTILKFMTYMEENHPRASEKLTVYYGKLRKEEKEANAKKFKSGESTVMLATKAFGMGIDIPDIDNVYHFAPTGNVCDYVQEIGRAARNLPKGDAYFDFLTNDFSHVRRLHGMSMISKQQLQMVAKKILSIYKENRNRSRNLLVSAEDFRYIFVENSKMDIEGDIDGKLKTALLLLEKDFTLRMGYSPFVARPRGIFSKEYFRVKPEAEKILNLKKNANYSRKIKSISDNPIYSAIYELDLKRIWEKEYRNLSFAKFKYLFHIKDSVITLPFQDFVDPILELKFSSRLPKRALVDRTNEILNHLDIFCRSMAMEKSYFQTSDLAHYLQKILKKDKYICEGIAQVVLQSMQRYGTISNNMNSNNVAKAHETRGYMILPGYQDFIKFISRTWDQYLNGTSLNWEEKTNVGTMYLPKPAAGHNEKVSILFGILEAFDIVNYQIIGGSNPEIYIRINSVLELERLVKHPEKYHNRILESVHYRHRLSVAMLTYIFKNKMDTTEFWDVIEEYFLGKIPEEVIVAADQIGKKDAVRI
jgi:ATP-dependent DNA helicase RecQ